MPAALDDRDVHAALAEVLGHLEADEAGSHDDRGTGLLAFDELVDAEGVLDGAEREEALGVDAG